MGNTWLLLTLLLVAYATARPEPVRYNEETEDDESSSSSEEDYDYIAFPDPTELSVNRPSDGSATIEADYHMEIEKAYRELVKSYTTELLMERILAAVESDLMTQVSEEDTVEEKEEESSSEEEEEEKEDGKTILTPQEIDTILHALISVEESSPEDTIENLEDITENGEGQVVIYNAKISTSIVKMPLSDLTKFVMNNLVPQSSTTPTAKEPVKMIEDPEALASFNHIVHPIHAVETHNVESVTAPYVYSSRGGFTVTLNLADLLLCLGAFVILIWVLVQLWKYFMRGASHLHHTATGTVYPPPLPAKEIPPPPAYSTQPITSVEQKVVPSSVNEEKKDVVDVEKNIHSI